MMDLTSADDNDVSRASDVLPKQKIILKLRCGPQRRDHNSLDASASQSSPPTSTKICLSSSSSIAPDSDVVSVEPTSSLKKTVCRTAIQKPTNVNEAFTDQSMKRSRTKEKQSSSSNVTSKATQLPSSSSVDVFAPPSSLQPFTKIVPRDDTSTTEQFSIAELKTKHVFSPEEWPNLDVADFEAAEILLSLSRSK